MMRSMFSGVSGLKAHQTRMDVIGNNIANVNTVGFKASRATFQEIFSQTLSSASSPDALSGRGGTNPMQVGLGMDVSAIDSLMGRGSVERTESPTDVSIEGEGFFIVGNGGDRDYKFTRAGNFTIDKQGNLVTSTGQNVYGWMKYEYGDDGYEFDTQEPIMPLNLFEDQYNHNKNIIAAQVTTEAVLKGNLDATEEPVGTAIDSINDGVDSTGATVSDDIPDKDGHNIDPQFIVPVNVYDKLGNEYKLNLKLWKNYVDADGGADGTPVTSWYYKLEGDANSGITDEDATGYLRFDSDGNIDPTSDINPTVTVTPDAATTGAAPFDFVLDMEQLSMYADDSSVKTSRVDGYAPGTLVTFSIGGDGIITGVYDNGRQQPLGQIALATFDNPAGLLRAGTNEFEQTTNSGNFDIAKQPGNDGAGVLVPGTLEMSNVDLSKQFTDMIITQRGFQANSKIITTSDEMLQELANLKR